MKRASGVLMHISTLNGGYSIGSFGREAIEFIDFLADAGFSYWQTLPFCMTDEYNSPYKSFSAFSLNPYFIDLETLCGKGYLTRAELAAARQETPYACEFERLGLERLKLLRLAASRAERGPVERFAEGNPQIARFAEFMALRERNGGTPWQTWRKKKADESEIFFWKFTQYEAYTEWQTIHGYAASRGVKIIGDMPMFVDIDSSDVYFGREEFLLDAKGYPVSIAGVPPDYFSADGQVWGNPHYDWEKMEAGGFAWWRERIRHMLTLFDGVRIDHFRGLESYFSIPAGAKTAKEGHWVKAKGRELIDAARDITDGKLIIAEDLGEITDEVARLVDYSGFPGMRVLQFGFLSSEDSPHRPHNYISNSVAYTGTHDNNTLLGHVWEMPAADRERLFAYCGYSGDLHGNFGESITRMMFASSAGLVMLPIQDLLMFGNDTRINIPGKSNGNWAFRITRENLAAIDRAFFKRLNELYAR